MRHTNEYDQVKCPLCGISWLEHSRDATCNQYRPPGDLARIPVSIATRRNLPQEQDHEMLIQATACQESHWYASCFVLRAQVITRYEDQL